jgi:hypothetical protein
MQDQSSCQGRSSSCQGRASYAAPCCCPAGGQALLPLPAQQSALSTNMHKQTQLSAHNAPSKKSGTSSHCLLTFSTTYHMMDMTHLGKNGVALSPLTKIGLEDFSLHSSIIFHPSQNTMLPQSARKLASTFTIAVLESSITTSSSKPMCCSKLCHHDEICYLKCSSLIKNRPTM